MMSYSKSATWKQFYLKFKGASIKYSYTKNPNDILNKIFANVFST